MFKEVFNLKSTSWHARLMKFTWNVRYETFSHMCPYFWISIANVLLFVTGITLAFKLLGKTLSGIGDLWTFCGEQLDHMADERRRRKHHKVEALIQELCKQIEAKSPKLLKQIASKDFYRRDHHDPLSRAFERFQRTILCRNDSMHKEFQSSLSKYREAPVVEVYHDGHYEADQAKERQKWERMHRLEEERKQRMIAVKRRITKILKIVKPIITGLAYIAGGLVLAGVIWLIYKLVVCLGNVKHETYTDIGGTSLFALGVIAAIAGACLLVYLLAKLLSKLTIRIKPRYRSYRKLRRFFETLVIPCKWIIRIVYTPLVWLGNALAITCKAIEDFVSLCIQMAKNQCPPIKWD